MTSMPSPNTEIDHIQLNRTETHFSSDFIEAYLHSENLKEFYSYEPNSKGLKKRIEDRSSFGSENRALLVKSIRNQYAKGGIDLSDSPVALSLNKLEQENCYTVTTGQQIHLGLGPLYVLYKVLNTIKLADEISQNEQIDAVPVFWMATEDHDLEEVQEIIIFGKHYRWDTDQTGAVGRMSTGGITSLLQSIEEELNLNQSQIDFLALAKKCYNLTNYADANRKLIHSLFERYGLIVLDADDQSLKSAMKEVFDHELRSKNYEALSRSTKQFELQNYGSQVYVRDINLFYLSLNGRSRIIKEEGGFYANDEFLCKDNEIQDFVAKNYHHISPNVLLRPLYQELILPNLIYVAGPSELKYWMQLKGLFEQYNLQLPLLFLRTSNIVLREKQLNKMDINDLSTFFMTDEDIITSMSEKMAEIEQKLQLKIDSSRRALKELSETSSELLAGFSLDSKLKKIDPKLSEIEQLISGRIKHLAQNNGKLNAVLKYKNTHFHAKNPQERVKHMVEFPELLNVDWGNKNLFGFDNLLKLNHLVTKSV